MILRYTIAWLPMVFIAIGNGILREFGYGKYMNELSAHQIASVTGIISFVLYAWFLSLLWPLESVGQTLAVGLIWLGLTIAFEFFFGHYVAKHPWPKLLQDYNIFAGRLWSLVLLTVATAPYIIYRMRG